MNKLHLLGAVAFVATVGVSYASESAVSVADLSTEIITGLPSGDYQMMDRNCHAIYSYQTLLSESTFSGSIVEIVTQADGTVYLSNPLEKAVSRHWIKGNKSGNILTFEGMQPIGNGNAREGYFSPDYLAVLDMSCERSEGILSATATLSADQTIRLEVGDDGRITPTDPQLCLGSVFYDYLQEEWMWNAVSNNQIELTPNSKSALPEPEGLQYEEWTLLSEGSAVPALVAIADGIFYIRDFSDYLGDTAFQGVIEGNKVTFKSGQYSKPVFSIMRYGYLSAATVERAVEEGVSYNLYTLADEIAFSYDAEGKVLKALDANSALCSNFSNDGLYYEEMWVNPTFQKYVHKSGVAPAAPTCMDFSDYHDYGTPFYRFALDIPNVDEDGAMLETKNLFLEVTVDGNVYIFSPSQYRNLKEDTSLLPYGYSDSEMAYVSKTEHDLLLVGNNMDNFLFRTVYIDGEEENYSDYCVYSVSGVSAIAAEREAVGVAYYDLSGVEVKSPGKGVYVMKTIYSDGNIEVNKIRK